MAVLLSPKGCQLLPPCTISLMSQIALSHVIFWKAWNPHWKRVSMKSISDKKEGSATSTRLLFVFCLGGWPCCTSYIMADVLTHIHNLFCKVTLKKLQILNSIYSMFFQVIQDKIVLSALFWHLHWFSNFNLSSKCCQFDTIGIFQFSRPANRWTCCLWYVCRILYGAVLYWFCFEW